MAAEAFGTAHQLAQKRSSIYWANMGSRLDYVCVRILCPLYVIGLIILFQIPKHMVDTTAVVGDSTVGDQGVDGSFITDGGLAKSLALPIICIALFAVHSIMESREARFDVESSGLEELVGACLQSGSEQERDSDRLQA
mmetsp:Transcript_50491/g.100506  ORF Transcript_50491/g.100506 Transcript_50491/m.100506 type:complete len:139 (-) Transcript_50491:385-801(-)